MMLQIPVIIIRYRLFSIQIVFFPLSLSGLRSLNWFYRMISLHYIHWVNEVKIFVFETHPPSSINWRAQLNISSIQVIDNLSDLKHEIYNHTMNLIALKSTWLWINPALHLLYGVYFLAVFISFFIDHQFIRLRDRQKSATITKSVESQTNYKYSHNCVIMRWFLLFMKIVLQPTYLEANDYCTIWLESIELGCHRIRNIILL